MGTNQKMNQVICGKLLVCSFGLVPNQKTQTDLSMGLADAAGLFVCV